MKTIKILLLVSILAVTQSFALSKTQRNILLGIGAGAIIIHALESQNDNHYEKPRKKIVYVDSHHSHKKYKKHHKRKHFNRNHRYYSHMNKHHYKKHHRRHHNRH